MHTVISISDARASLPTLVEKVNAHNEEIVITVNGRPKAVIMGWYLG